MEERKFRWEEERKALEKAKSDASQKIRQRYEGQIDDLKRSFNKTLEELKHLTKSLHKIMRLDLKLLKSVVKLLAILMSNKGLSNLSASMARGELPEKPCTIDDPKVGQKVFIVSLGKEATITKLQKGDKELIEVSADFCYCPTSSDLRSMESNKKTSIKRPHIKEENLFERMICNTKFF